MKRRITRRSGKAKGRSACLEVRDLLLAYLPLHSDDIHVKTGSEPGADLHLSPATSRLFPFSVESKNQERVNIWGALAQATANTQPGQKPVVFFKRNRSEMYVALRAADFLALFDS